MSAEDNLSQEMFHGTRAILRGKTITPMSGVAYATSDPEAAMMFAKTKLPEGKLGDAKVYKVAPLDDVEERAGNFPGEKHYSSKTGFKVIGEHP
jgi:hypothetical protein